MCSAGFDETMNIAYSLRPFLHNQASARCGDALYCPICRSIEMGRTSRPWRSSSMRRLMAADIAWQRGLQGSATLLEAMICA